MVAGWEVLPDRHVVSRGGEERLLEPRLMQVLLHLAERPGQVITRTDLLERVWGETYVQEEALTQAISQLRRTLDDDSRSPTIIATIPKQGYRLIGEVSYPLPDEPTGVVSTNRRPIWLRAGGAVAICTLAVWLFFARHNEGPEPSPPPQILAERPLTVIPGHEAFPAVSPYGQFVVFSLRPEGTSVFKLYLKRIGSENLTALTDEPGHEMYPRWSPEGERIAFVRRTEAGRRLCVVAAMGGPVQTLGPVYHLLGDLDWTPDGRRIVFSGKEQQEAPMLLMRIDLSGALTDTLTRPEQLSRGDNLPRFSPDGTTLAFVRGDRGSSRDVFVMPSEGGPPRRLTNGFFSCGGMDWAPDGKSLIISATLRGPYELWRVPLDGTEPILLAVKGHRSLQPSCAKGRGPLVFVDRTLNTDLLLGTVGGEQEPEPVAPSTRIESSGRFSPDGSRVLFVSERSGSNELWVVNPADGSVRQLTEAAGDALRKPRWSPDGRRVALNVARQGLLQVVVVDVATGLQRQVTPGEGHYRFGHWSADGQWVFYSREKGPDWQIAKVRLDGSGAVDIQTDGCLSLHEQPVVCPLHRRPGPPFFF
jgi:Tol biopolymer transport system component/DNA-binding winged helix-turn-helix (wHTH) protein